MPVLLPLGDYLQGAIGGPYESTSGTLYIATGREGFESRNTIVISSTDEGATFPGVATSSAPNIYTPSYSCFDGRYIYVLGFSQRDLNAQPVDYVFLDRFDTTDGSFHGPVDTGISIDESLQGLGVRLSDGKLLILATPNSLALDGDFTASIRRCAYMLADCSSLATTGTWVPCGQTVGDSQSWTFASTELVDDGTYLRLLMVAKPDVFEGDGSDIFAIYQQSLDASYTLGTPQQVASTDGLGLPFGQILVNAAACSSSVLAVSFGQTVYQSGTSSSSPTFSNGSLAQLPSSIALLVEGSIVYALYIVNDGAGVSTILYAFSDIEDFSTEIALPSTFNGDDIQNGGIVSAGTLNFVGAPFGAVIAFSNGLESGTSVYLSFVGGVIVANYVGASGGLVGRGNYVC